MESAYRQLTKITNGSDAVLQVALSVFCELMDRSLLLEHEKQRLIEQAKRQLLKQTENGAQ